MPEPQNLRRPNCRAAPPERPRPHELDALLARAAAGMPRSAYEELGPLWGAWIAWLIHDIDAPAKDR